MGDDVYGPVFAGGIGLMFVGVISAFIVGNLIPDDAWDFLANEGFEEEERLLMEKREEKMVEREREDRERRGGARSEATTKRSRTQRLV